jgi:hypothetical protein
LRVVQQLAAAGRLDADTLRKAHAAYGSNPSE